MALKKWLDKLALLDLFDGLAVTGRHFWKKKVTIQYPEQKKIPSDRFRGMFAFLFFFVAHDPTELNRQGPDSGTQYRSSIFYANDVQKKMADDYIARLNQKQSFVKPIATKVVPLTGFYPAEPYHQNYLALHPDQAYIVINDMPKLDRLRESFPALYQQ